MTVESWANVLKTEGFLPIYDYLQRANPELYMILTVSSAIDFKKYDYEIFYEVTMQKLLLAAIGTESVYNTFHSRLEPSLN